MTRHKMTAASLLETSLRFFVLAAGEGIEIDGISPEEAIANFFDDHCWPEADGDYGADFQDYVMNAAAREMKPL